MTGASAIPARPAVTLKLATSLDGKIATRTGQSQWITGAEARAETHKLRAAHSAIMVGSGTVLADNPMLTARCDPPAERQPKRIIADGRLRTPLSSCLVQTANENPVVLCVGVDIDDRRFDDYMRAGVEVWETQISPMGGVSVSGMLSRCSEEGIDSVFLEGGGQLAASFLRAGMVDRIEWFRAPMILGSDGLACTAQIGVDELADAAVFKRTGVRECGPDLWESYVAVDKDGLEG
ncbi:MAG: riboflavin biosynthesis protein RibD [Hirschia sp.]|nr:riboflavin biosynthesis protein RibD [Hirschia sp.]MBF19897.1 riboflavin biosynthesis protein RibD [Hirschia sp.]